MACGHSDKSNKILQEAYEVHKKSVLVRAQLNDQLTMLRTAEYQEENKAEIDSIELQVKEWDGQLIEVPGIEEEHDHSGHDHNHEVEVKLSPDQHLKLQEHLLLEIRSIENKINELMQSNK